MPQDIGPPSIPTIKNTSERARIIVERAEQQKPDALRSKKGAQSASQPQERRIIQNVRSELREIPPRYNNATYAQVETARVERVHENMVHLKTDGGTIVVKVDDTSRFQRNDIVEVRIPPQTKIGDSVYISQVAPEDKSQITENKIPRSESTARYPPINVGQHVITTERPITDYKLPGYTQTEGNQTRPVTLYTPETFQRAVENMTPKIIPDNQPRMKMPPPLMAMAASFRLNPDNPYAALNRPAIAPPAQYTPMEIKIISLPTGMQSGNVAPSNPDENVLTQSPQNVKALKAISQQSTVQPASSAATTALMNSLLQTDFTKPQTDSFFKSQHIDLSRFIQSEAPLLRHFQDVKILSIIPANTSISDTQKMVQQALETSKQPTQIAKKSTGNIQLATIVGATQNGETILTLPAAITDKTNSQRNNTQVLFIQTPVFGSIGTQMLISVENLPLQKIVQSPNLQQQLPQTLQQIIPTATGAMAATLPPPLNAPSFSSVWPALSESLNVLNMNTPQAAQAIQNAIPSPSPTMPSAALFFLAALKMGNIDNWLGERNINNLREMGKNGLAERLSGDFSRIASQSRSEGALQWKTLNLPFLYEGEISIIHLHVRSDDQKKESEEEKVENEDSEKTRFVLDLTLSRIGQVQIDGYLTSQTLDMILRSEQRLNETPRQDMMRIFANTLETLGLKGGLIFQNNPEKWIKFNENPKNY